MSVFCHLVINRYSDPAKDKTKKPQHIVATDRKNIKKVGIKVKNCPGKKYNGNDSNQFQKNAH